MTVPKPRLLGYLRLLPLVIAPWLRGDAIINELTLSASRCARYLSQQTGAARFFGCLLRAPAYILLAG
jgi:hypothetical protein